MGSRAEKPISRGDKLAYGSGNFATGVAMQVLGTYLVFYATAVLGLPGGIIGIVMGVSILWDAVTDPIMGYLSDRSPHRGLGRRHPYLIVGALGVALTNYLVWNVDASLDPGFKLALICLWVLLFKTFITIYVTPYSALGAELSTDYNERTSIQGVKSVFFILGLAFVSVAGMYWFFKPSPGYPVGQLDPGSYSSMALASSAIILVSALACIVPTLKHVPEIRERNLAFPHREPANMADSLARAFRNKPFRSVVLAYMFSNLSSALLANLGLIVFTYTFGLGNREIAGVVGVQFLFAALSQAPWARVSRRWGKRFALTGGFLLGIAGSLYFALLVLLRESLSGNIWVFVPFGVLAGSGLGALFTLPLSMVADTVDLDEAGGGERIEGVYFGALTFLYKFTQAIALVLIGFLLDLAGFDKDLPSQAGRTQLVLGLVLGIGAAICFACALLANASYGLDEAAVAACRERIEERRREASLARDEPGGPPGPGLTS
jgi:GPH family glycoside/pentoside/hexuronide:cation symporter